MKFNEGCSRQKKGYLNQEHCAAKKYSHLLLPASSFRRSEVYFIALVDQKEPVYTKTSLQLKAATYMIYIPAGISPGSLKVTDISILSDHCNCSGSS